MITRTFTIGSTRHLIICDTQEGADDEAAKQIAKALRPGGPAVHFPDGSQAFVTDHEQHPPVWDKSGNRTRHARLKVTVSPDGERTTEHVRFVYKSPF